MIEKYTSGLYKFFESKKGHWIIGIIVILNALVLGAQTFKRMPEHWVMILENLDKIVLAFFILELLTKIVVQRKEFFQSGWNLFDFFVVGGSLFNSQIYFSVLRSLRTLHLMSMVDALPKIRHIIGGLWKSIPGISSVLIILLLFFYIASVMGVFLFRDTGVEEFQHIGIAMKTMFQVLTGDNWSDIMKSIEHQGHPHAWIYFVSFYIIIVFIILNLFIGVVVGALQSAEEEVYLDDKENETLSAIMGLKNQLIILEKKLDALQGTSGTTPDTSLPPSR